MAREQRYLRADELSSPTVSYKHPYRQGHGKERQECRRLLHPSGSGDRFIAMNVAAGDSPTRPSTTSTCSDRPPAVRPCAALAQRGDRRRLRDVRVEGNKAVVGKPSRERLGYLADHPWRPIADVLLLDEKTGLHDHDDDATSTFYAESWLLVHDLFFGASAALQTARRRFSRAMRVAGRKGRRFEKSFEGGIAGLEAELREYLRGRQPYITLTFDELRDGRRVGPGGPRARGPPRARPLDDDRRARAPARSRQALRGGARDRARGSEGEGAVWGSSRIGTAVTTRPRSSSTRPPTRASRMRRRCTGGGPARASP